MAGQRDYYAVLGVPRDADARTIKDAFRDLALKHHPDRNREPGSEERFKEIAEAYAVLSDPHKRHQYDARGFSGVAGLSPEDLFAGIDLEDVFGGFARDFGFGDSLFDRLFRSRRPERGHDVEIVAEVPLEFIATGGPHRVGIPHAVECSHCGGSGAEPPAEPRQCDACDGSGRLISRRTEGATTVQRITTCGRCRGTGTVIDEPCERCRGAGRVDEWEELEVEIPIGVDDGTALRVPGKGMAGPPDTPPGDLLIVVRSAPHGRFRRRGADLWHGETISVEDAVLGTSMEVPTLGEPVLVTIPPGTQPGEILRLAGKGLPTHGEDRHGDLMLVIDVHIPQQIDEDERRLFEELRRLRRSANLERTGTDT